MRSPRRLRRLSVILTALGLLGVLVLLVGPLRTQLAVRQLESGDASERAAAARLLGVLSHRSAVPALVRALADGDTEVRKTATESLLAIEGDRLALIAEPLRKLAAAEDANPTRLVETLAVVEFSPVPLLEPLLARFSEVNARLVDNSLPEAVAQCGEKAVPRLVELLSSDSRDVRENAVRSLGELGARAAPAAKDILALLRRDDDPLTRQYAALALAGIGPAAWPAAEMLVTLADVDPAFESSVDTVLGGVGPAALPVLVSWLRDEDSGRTLRAARLVSSHGRRGDAAVPDLIRLLGSKDPEIVRAACRALGAIATREAATVPALSGFLHLEHAEIVQEACRALGAIGTRAIGALPKLLSLLESADDLHVPESLDSSRDDSAGTPEEPPFPPSPLLRTESVYVELSYLPSPLERVLSATGRAAAGAIVQIDAEGKAPFELLFRHAQGFSHGLALDWSRSSDGGRWASLDRYRGAFPDAGELAAALRHSGRSALALAVLERRPALAADPAVRRALRRLMQRSPLLEGITTWLPPEDRRAMIVRALEEWKERRARGTGRRRLGVSLEARLVSILSGLEALDEIERVVSQLSGIRERVECAPLSPRWR